LAKAEISSSSSTVCKDGEMPPGGARADAGLLLLLGVAPERLGGGGIGRGLLLVADDED
jgi:hypothetical protein